jgi:putative spermidine/putrescine transport system ATP-binding protein
VAGVRIEGLRKAFGRHVVVDIPELTIADGSFFSLLGPSGCGKTTTLRLIAGLARADAGTIFIGGRDATNLEPSSRNLGMVFQKHALFPHLTVRENVAFGLRERRVAPAEAARAVDEALAQVALPYCADRLPHQLSGGQQQRVAIARAIVYRPDVLLLDEPLSSLDVKLRVTLRNEFKRLQHTIGVTTIFVTHDQQEALALSDGIGVMRDGRMEQVGTPQEIYDAPASVFVAEFVGGTNVLRGVIPDAHLALKPERVRIEPAPATTPASGAIVTHPGTLESVSYLGSSYSYHVRLEGQTVEVRTADVVSNQGRPLTAGDAVVVSFERAAARVLAR